MKESAFTAKLLKALRAHPALRDRAAIIKHANPFHRGIPDFSVTIQRRTWWYEVKKRGEKPTKIQLWHLHRMDGDLITFHGNEAFITPLQGFGWLSINELTEEIVSRCNDRN